MLRPFAFAVFAAPAVLVFACSGTALSEGPATSDATPQPSTTTSTTATGTATTTTPTATPDAGDAAIAPTPLPPFEFLIDGKARASASITAVEQNPSGALACRKSIRLRAQLVPQGTESTSPAPYLSVDVCVSLLPPSKALAYGDYEDGLARVIFGYQEPGLVRAVPAEGKGVQLVQDGTMGVLELSASGTLEVQRGVTKPFTLKLRQAVTK